ncbi:hypothetical protein AQ490_23140 [Wenjunlia vitaminophila]|uniref:Uncharacterized protein n=1 Tax=Wenjunlia vitaminophila TaxID=76728 RepID=A0A0T6LSH7_WENVI|nr:hypothetical protein [Wenjunlia vitaminophila]KRV48770.1 hypothetical protein AQ490_23140 [Wenjunlia vitaminophila]
MRYDLPTPLATDADAVAARRYARDLWPERLAEPGLTWALGVCWRCLRGGIYVAWLGSGLIGCHRVALHACAACRQHLYTEVRRQHLEQTTTPTAPQEPAPPSGRHRKPRRIRLPGLRPAQRDAP